jgi:zinc transport system substrate-binding protein
MQWLLLIGVSVWVAGVSWAQSTPPISTFVSILPQKQMLERVGGNLVKVQVLVQPGQSPHSYEPTPKQMVELARATVYFKVGVAFENVWAKKIQQAHPKLKMVDTRQGIKLRAMTPAAHLHDEDEHHDHHPDEKHEHEGHTHHDGELDPHIWTTPLLVKQQALNMRNALIQLSPQYKTQFEAGYAAYAAELDQLHQELNNKLSKTKSKRFMVFHPVWGYLADAYGLQELAIEVEGKEPSPKTLAMIINKAKAENIQVIFVQPQFSQTAAQQVARSIKGRVVIIDPLAEDVVGNLRQVGATLAQALQ